MLGELLVEESPHVRHQVLPALRCLQGRLRFIGSLDTVACVVVQLLWEMCQTQSREATKAGELKAGNNEDPSLLWTF